MFWWKSKLDTKSWQASSYFSGRQNKGRWMLSVFLKENWFAHMSLVWTYEPCLHTALIQKKQQKPSWRETKRSTKKKSKEKSKYWIMIGF